VVTEYGHRDLKGLSCYDRAKALISLAHPKFRDGLIADAKARGLL
jgi:acyl-CoA hydrolase